MELTAAERKRRSQRVLQNRRDMEARRIRYATEYRTQLLAQLGDAGKSAAAGGLVEAAVSSYVVVREFSYRFERGRANPRSIQTLSLARGQLQRALALLFGLSHDSADASPSSPASARDWLAAQNESAQDGAV
jgi:hypothetical protein